MVCPYIPIPGALMKLEGDIEALMSDPGSALDPPGSRRYPAPTERVSSGISSTDPIGAGGGMDARLAGMQ